MKTKQLIPWLIGIFISVLTCPLSAQSYGRLWEEVETSQKKDLPQSVIEITGRIYAKAKAERNLPQMMKAHLIRASVRASLTPDSARAEQEILRRWAEQETDTVARAVLNSLMGSVVLENFRDSMDVAIRYFRLSVTPRELLGNTPAKEFSPMTEPGKRNEDSSDGNMLDLLTRRAIRYLLSYGTGAQRLAAYEECLRLYDGLATFYEGWNRPAFLLTEIAKLWFQKQQMENFVSYRLSADEVVCRLYRLIESYGDLPACADAYVKLVEIYRDEGELAKAVKVAREGLDKYPDGRWAENLQAQIDYITRPQLNVSIPFIYPHYDAEIKVSYANLEGVTLELYRMDFAPSAAALRLRDGMKYETLLKQYGRKLSSTSYVLAPVADYCMCDTVLRYRLPEEGIYMLKQIPEGQEKGIAYSLLFVSPYQAVDLPVEDNKREFIAIDRLTGQPVPEAEVVTYKLDAYDPQADYKVWNVHRTDSHGRTVITMPENATVYYNVRTAGNDYMAIGAVRRNGMVASQSVTEWKRHASLFTDRSLYRPGQTVQVSGVVYEQWGDSTRVVGHAGDKLRLYSGSRSIGEADVCTDEFGVFSHEFVLPDNLSPGQYSLSGYRTFRVIQVDEYKRPTFDVRFDPYKETYAMGDSVCLTAEARTYAGAPVRGARVKYKVSRTEMSWLRWQGNTEELVSGETQTDAEGRFLVGVLLEQPVYEVDHTYYVYKVLAEVTDGAGETRKEVLDLPVGKQALGLQVKGLDENVMREKQVRIQFQALNMDCQPVQVEVNYKVYALDQEDRKDSLCYEGKAETMRSFIPVGVWALPSGRYRMEMSALDGNGHLCTAEQDFVLFSKEDRVSPVKSALWCYQDGNSFGEDMPPTFYIGTDEEDICLFINVYNGEKRLNSCQVSLNKEMKPFSFPYQDAYGDAVSVSFVFMRKGNLYTSQSRIIRPLPDKRLVMKWKTFRDKLQPGAEEMWTLHIARPSGVSVEANLMAVLYDASLDALRSHEWRFPLSFQRLPMYVRAGFASVGQQVWISGNFSVVYPGKGTDWLYGDYGKLFYSRIGGLRESMVLSRNMATQSYRANIAELVAEADADENLQDMVGSTDIKEDNNAEWEIMPVTVLRRNFAETAFFYPRLHTGSSGDVSITFTVPDALTQWRFMGFAHTRAMDYGLLMDTVQTLKPFMVQPNFPRFVRKGDRAVIMASLVNLSMENVAGTVRIEWVDPVTEQKVAEDSQAFSVVEGGTSVAHFDFKVPDRYDVLVCRVVAESDGFGDGEQHYLPVLTDKQWVTETIPVQLDGTTVKTVSTSGLFNKQGKTATGQRLTVEMTANPGWYAIQALPVIGSPVDDDALSWATAYYANALSSHIVRTTPHIEEMFRAWKAERKEAEILLSNLESNQELKNLLFAEMPWLAEAIDETEQKRRIALLFDLNATSKRLQAGIEKLQSLQLPDGSWSWYKGMAGSRYITTQVVELLARLQAMGVKPDAEVEKMYTRALVYLKTQVQKDYESMRRMETQKDVSLMPDGEVIHYLYICSIDQRAMILADEQVNGYFLSKLENRSMEYTIREKALVSIILNAAGRARQAMELVHSIKEYAVSTEEMGTYFDTQKAHYSWVGYKIPTQVSAMEAIRLIAPDTGLLDGMKQWLLKQKQVQVWETPVATADAVYALLCAEDSLTSVGSMTAVAGGHTWQTPHDALGYAKQVLTGEDAKVADIRFERVGEGIGWGAVYAQYLEEMDEVLPSDGTGLQIKREYFRNGEKLAKDATLHVGDKLTVRLTVMADRDMDFICVKDERAACMELEQQLSGYRWNRDIGYYFVSHDASVSFCIDRMPKGTYRLEYTVYIDRTGTYQAGIAIVQSAYAPEYSAHTGGRTLIVE